MVWEMITLCESCENVNTTTTLLYIKVLPSLSFWGNWLYGHFILIKNSFPRLVVAKGEGVRGGAEWRLWLADVGYYIENG